MARLRTITKFLREDMRVKYINDSSLNRVQIRGKEDVKRIALGVDASMELFSKAKDKGCDMIIVHHGILWKGQKTNPEIKKKRIDFLRKNNISLFAAHLPLDAHPEYGNNIGIARMIGLRNLKRFGAYKKLEIGFFGDIETTLQKMVNLVNRELKTESTVHGFGRKKVKKAGIVSGGGTYAVADCKKRGIDTLITGETSHTMYHFAKEYGINVIYAGHYKTETVGLKALSKVLEEKFNIQTVFIDIPTGL